MEYTLQASKIQSASKNLMYVAFFKEIAPK